MAQRKTLKRPAIALASLAFHALILTGLALHAPHAQRLATPEDLIPVTVLPRYLPPREAPPRLPRPEKVLKKDRPQEDLTVPPRIVDPLPFPAAPRAAGTDRAITAEQLGQALRNGGVGCNPPGLPGLSREAREICEARLATGARNARYLGNGMAPDKQAGFDQAAASGNAWRKAMVPAEMGHADVSAEAALKRNQMAPGRPGDTQANWTLAGKPF